MAAVKIGVRLPRLIKNLLYGFFAFSLVTGFTFFILNQFIIIEGPFGPQKHPSQKYFLMAHGASAFIIMTLFGMMLASHVPKTWPLKKNKITGMMLVIIVSLQMITAYCLYYLVLGEYRIFLIYTHLITGIALPVALIGHLIRIKVERKINAKQMENL